MCVCDYVNLFSQYYYYFDFEIKFVEIIAVLI